MRKRR